MTISVVQTGPGGTFGSAVTPGNWLLLVGGTYSFGTTTVPASPALGGSALSGAAEVEAATSGGTGGGAAYAVWLYQIQSGDTGATAAGCSNGAGDAGSPGVVAFELHSSLGLPLALGGALPVTGSASAAWTLGPAPATTMADELAIAAIAAYTTTPATTDTSWTTATGGDTLAGYQAVPASGTAVEMTGIDTGSYHSYAGCIITLFESSGPPAGDISLSGSGAFMAVGSNTAAPPDTTSDNGGVLGPYLYPGITSSNGSNTFVNNNVWNPVSGATQALTVNSPGDWSITANIPDTSEGAIVSYADVQQLYPEVPLSHWSSLTASWTEIMNANPDSLCEAAFDIWLNNFGNEVMIWVDCTPGQAADLPFDINLGQVTIGGQLYTVWHNPGSTEYIYQQGDMTQPSGSADVLGVLLHAQANGYIPQGSTLNAIEFGWEIASTNGADETFIMSAFSITETFGSRGHAGAARRL